MITYGQCVVGGKAKTLVESADFQPGRIDMSDPLYQTQEWKATRAVVLRRDRWLCQWCLVKKRLTSATLVHHIKELKHYRDLALDIDNLISLCDHCHSQYHRRREKRGRVEDKRIKRKARVIKG